MGEMAESVLEIRATTLRMKIAPESVIDQACYLV